MGTRDAEEKSSLSTVEMDMMLPACVGKCFVTFCAVWVVIECGFWVLGFLYLVGLWG